ncbi:MAG: hypothetical protein AB1352_02085 [Patescibacteria group bacterium]
MTRKQLTTLILVLILVAAGATALMWSIKKPQSPNQLVAENGGKPTAPESQPQNNGTKPTPTPEVITSDIDTSDWKTYRNEELGFQIKYPNEWGIDEEKIDHRFNPG